jgi:hypothetical protein
MISTQKMNLTVTSKLRTRIPPILYRQSIFITLWGQLEHPGYTNHFVSRFCYNVVLRVAKLGDVFGKPRSILVREMGDVARDMNLIESCGVLIPVENRV